MAYSYSGAEISYPSKPFLRLIPDTQNRSFGKTAQGHIYYRKMFWDHTMELVEMLADELQTIYLDRGYFDYLFQKLLTYGDDYEKRNRNMIGNVGHLKYVLPREDSSVSSHLNNMNINNNLMTGGNNNNSTMLSVNNKRSYDSNASNSINNNNNNNSGFQLQRKNSKWKNLKQSLSRRQTMQNISSLYKGKEYC